MSHWQQYSETERLQLLNIASAEMSLPRLAVEKDWWVTTALKALANTSCADLYSFKGGSSLSKGWGLIERFSEDIDIALNRKRGFAISGFSNSQLAKVRRKSRHYIVRILPEELSDSLAGLGVRDFRVEAELSRMIENQKIDLRADTHPSVLYLHYKSIVPEMSDYLSPRVKIEVSCLSMEEPVEKKTIRSFLSEVRPEADDMYVDFNTVVPTRTFLEKIFLLHEEFQKSKPRSRRMSRHLYDLECIMDTQFGREALADRKLYDEIINHRSVFNRMEGIDYRTHSPRTINFMPPDRLIEEWRKDYDAMSGNFLYHRDSRLSFSRLMERLTELTNRIRSMDSAPVSG